MRYSKLTSINRKKNNEISTDALRAVAIKAAKAAGAVHKKYFEKKITVRTKKTSFDLLTNADVEAERAATRIIKHSFADHNFLAEEKRYKKTNSLYTWIIDPLDGTNNFFCGLPIFAASVALAKDGQVIVGAVYDVSRDELFYAEKGKGSFLNGKRIKVASAKTLKESLLITGFYYDRGKDMIDNLARMKEFFLKRILGLRRLGAASLDLCYVACGRAAGFWEFVLSPWDFAAGKLLIEEAGGKVTDCFGRAVELRPSYIIASNTKIHKAMLKILRKSRGKS
ncbi:inositol monophosphatase family protein [Candidatus Omnitrophota bacterium]